MTNFNDIIGHRDIVLTLKKSVLKGRIAHAYLFAGPPGVGKKTMAGFFARVLLCESPQEGDACGNCRSCRQAEADNNPDLHLIRPTGASIKIEQMRELIRKVQFKPYQGERQVFIIEQAETMTVEAANSFLKTLEEPAGHSVFILITDQPHLVLPTILSRCLILQLRPLSNKQITQWLVNALNLECDKAAGLAPLAGGSIGRAMALARGDESPELRTKVIGVLNELPHMSRFRALTVAEELAGERSTAEKTLDIMLLWFRDLLVYNYTSDKNNLVNRELAEQAAEQCKRYGSGNLVAILEEIKQARAHVAANTNSRLSVEVLMIKLQSYGGFCNAS